MTTLDLPVSMFDRPRARRTDPTTSHKAGLAARFFANSHKARILDALKTHGPRSAHELSLLIGLTVVQIDRRLPEMGAAVHVLTVDGVAVERGGCRVWAAA